MIYSMIFMALVLGAIGCAAAISRADFRRRIIPDVYLLPLAVIGLVLITFWGWPVTIVDGVIGAAAGYVIATGADLVFRAGRRGRADKYPPIGMGDIKLLTTGGLWLGPTGLAMATVVACIGGVLWGWRHHSRYIPLAPFFVGGAIIALIAIWFLL